MQKADSLRAHLVQWFPDLARDPDRLRLWIETGKIRAINADARHFAWEYSLTVLLADWTADPSGLAIVINEWCRINAPELLQQGSGYAFEADILDSSTFDVQFALPLSEAVLVTDREGGGWNLEHPAEPAPLFPDDEPAGGLLRQIWRAGEMIVPLAPEA